MTTHGSDCQSFAFRNNSVEDQAIKRLVSAHGQIGGRLRNLRRQADLLSARNAGLGNASQAKAPPQAKGPNHSDEATDNNREIARVVSCEPCAEPNDRLQQAVNFIPVVLSRTERIAAYLETHPQFRLTTPYALEG